MKSIKPGRGPSAMGAIGSIAVGVFGIIWTIAASSMGAPSFFVFFGIVFVGIAIIQAIFHFKNAAGKNRMSLFDITDSHAEPDPLNKLFNNSKDTVYRNDDGQLSTTNNINFCPYCGNKIHDDSYNFCSSCGKEIRK